MKKRTHQIKWRRVLVSGLFLFGIGFGLFQMDKPLYAAAKTWDGGGGNNLFNTAANWSGDTLPTNGDSLIFDVTGLGASTTLTNDMVGLSVTGITFSGNNANYDYTIAGNALSVSGTITESTTDNHASNVWIPGITADLNLTGPTTIHSVFTNTGTITNNGYLLTLSSDSGAGCAITTIRGVIAGSGNIAVQSGGAVLINGNNPAYTGAVTVANGGGLSFTALGLQSASGITSQGGDLSIYLNSANRTLTAPITTSGNLYVDSGFLGTGCSGGSDIGYNLTLSGAFTQTGDVVYEGSAFTGVTNTTVTGTYVSNGHTTTNSVASKGTLTVPAPVPDTVPGAPTGLTPTVGSAQVGLSWTAPASDGGDAISDYVVQYKLTSSGSWSTFADGAGTGTSTTVTGLTNGSSYDFRVMAVNGVGQSAAVTTTGVTPLAVPTVSDAPTGLMGTPGNTQVLLNWTVPASNGGSAITDYQVQYKLTSSGSWSTFADGTSTATNATVTGLTNSSSYDFQVRAVNGIGNSAYNTITGVTPSSGATAPVAATQLGAVTNTTNGDLTLGWTAPASNGGSAITNYLIEIKLSSDASWTTVAHAPFTGNSFVITTGLTDDSVYDIRVSAINAIGTGSPVSLLGFTYDSTTGSTEPIDNAGGSGSGGTVGAPNTGIFAAMTNPALLVGLGITSAFILMVLAFKRRSVR